MGPATQIVVTHGLTATQALLLHTLADMGGVVSDNQSGLLRLTGIASKPALKKAIAALKRRGIIAREHRNLEISAEIWQKSVEICPSGPRLKGAEVVPLNRAHARARGGINPTPKGVGNPKPLRGGRLDSANAPSVQSNVSVLMDALLMMRLSGEATESDVVLCPIGGVRRGDSLKELMAAWNEWASGKLAAREGKEMNAATRKELVGYARWQVTKGNNHNPSVEWIEKCWQRRLDENRKREAGRAA